MARIANGDVDEDTRVAGLLQAQARAAELFAAVGEREIVRAGVSERKASDQVRDLAAELFGIEKFWHKRIVRAGPHTLLPYDENPPDRVIEDDDIAFCDFGPIFEAWEADFGRTFVIGDDPAKHALRDALPVLFDAGRAAYETQPDLTAADLYDYVVDAAATAGWEFGGELAGHLVGEFPHWKFPGGRTASWITPGNSRPLRGHDRQGRRLHWILEIHLVDRTRQIGGFYEELLDI